MLKRELEYFFGAIRFFTRLPVPGWVGHSAEALNQSARYFPQPVADLLSMAVNSSLPTLSRQRRGSSRPAIASAAAAVA